MLHRIVSATALALAALAACAQAVPAPAAAGAPGIDQRQAAQGQRIDQGAASGQLTRREELRLERQQARIDRAENRAKADGVVTGQERKRLHAAQDAASANIARQKHDRLRKPASS
jgi:hypothetical protein